MCSTTDIYQLNRDSGSMDSVRISVLCPEYVLETVLSHPSVDLIRARTTHHCKIIHLSWLRGEQ